MRLTLLPNLRRLWRDARTVQLGTDPAVAVVVEFASPGAVRLLDLLDGTRTRDDVVRHAEHSLALAPADATAVLDALLAARLLLDAADLLPAGLPSQVRHRLAPESTALALHHPGMVPAEALRRRQAARITISGTGTLVAPISVALAAAGVGHVDPVVDGLGRPDELVALIGATAAGTRVAPIRAGAVTLAVRVGPGLPAATGGQRRGAALSVAIRDCTVLVGPLVGPGGSPCGHCLDLHRGDSDPRWPVLAAQLATGHGPADGACALTTALAGAACAAEEALRYVDGRAPRTTGAIIEIAAPGAARRRSWPAHPRCGCRRGSSPGAASRSGATLSAQARPSGRNDGWRRSHAMP